MWLRYLIFLKHICSPLYIVILFWGFYLLELYYFEAIVVLLDYRIHFIHLLQWFLRFQDCYSQKTKLLIPVQSVDNTGQCWAVASEHKRWILFWWHLPAFAATTIWQPNSTHPNNGWNSTHEVIAQFEHQLRLHRLNWYSICYKIRIQTKALCQEKDSSG